MSATNGTTTDKRDRLARAVESFVANIYSLRRESLRELFDPRRNLEDEIGAPRLSATINPEEYQQYYERNPYAARVVEVLPKESWQIQPQVYEAEEGEEATAFEQAWDGLARQLRSSGLPSYYQDEAGSPIWKALKDLDILAGIEHYGCGLFGLDDGKPLHEPASPRPGQRLLFFRTFPEYQAVVTRWDADLRSPRYGHPLQYNITLQDPREDIQTGIGLSVGTHAVHWTRVLHVADRWHQTTSSEVYAPPRMRPVWNNLLGLHKILAGDPEAYWKNCLMKFFLETHPELGGDVEIDRAALRDELEPFMNGLEQFFSLMGMTAKPIAPVVVDPTAHVEVQVKAICIKLGCPVPVFEGYEIGEQASTNNDSDWKNRLRERRQAFITPSIICPFIDRLIWLGVLPQPSGYSVYWPDLATQSEAEKAQVALTKTQALTTFIGGNGEAAMDLHDFYTRFLELDEEEATAILEGATAAVGTDTSEETAQPSAAPPVSAAVASDAEPTATANRWTSPQRRQKWGAELEVHLAT